MDKKDPNSEIKVTASEAEGQKKNEAPGTAKKPAGVSLRTKLLAAAAGALAVLLAILIPIIVNASVEKKVKKAFDTYVGVFVTGDISADDVRWRKYYPEEAEEEVLEWAKEKAGSGASLSDYDYKIMAVTRLSGGDNAELVQDLVEEFYRYHDFSIKITDLKISKAYLVIIRNYSGKGPALDYALVVKVNGSYGVYSLANEISH